MPKKRVNDLKFPKAGSGNSKPKVGPNKGGSLGGTMSPQGTGRFGVKAKSMIRILSDNTDNPKTPKKALKKSPRRKK